MLKDKVAIVTGASRGIGKSIAINFARQGSKVVLNYRSDDNGAETTKQEIEQNGGVAILHKGDVSDFYVAEELMNFCKEKFSRIDILVNNAGITRDTLVMRMKEEDFDSVINVNLKGSFNCAKHASSIMLRQKSGKIINISSVIGIIGNAGQVNYAASKAGIIGMTKSLAKELGSRGINVNAIAPGFIETDMTDVLGDNVKETILSHIPLKKMGKTEDVSNLAVFLASNMSDYITGQVITVDGGMVM
ncbi:3-ketoacyl-(acyl-carrier-protein) reductase [Candidatus Arthromitus sp. SFB-mouse-Japan]|uniref:3-oxoacyl-[acyl-carrier-protein] reductase n=1 Tax=Candidatus Arthromitus sp. SFB-mouse TaxID=49118 RepID=UPI00021B7D4C|nr:3-oxoacyl-[acyl-carrier-protein] reductase [Candidatus Arthromitus sp. SFB-mouse]EIA24468.1 3-oxoacyl-[acyl-carrier-protein] reductase [Candidatus Arthromitus sp. SFB-1]EIA27750.1 3-oxoacyl-[acyl-carrier-protein] reductase [Candidatus Arthromitus sp. SFB-co]EIA29297.1 3-oxoacyl-[acyl-carrier-protein] reductase [Candidatus Arthromitus sp. SFB-5]EIA30891.1 3-oxoacyl-[acyl-carrier-protein] reductase [Candidatus Arthromitus sp. SFB-mouse-SU]EIA31480.1 3-oxoacyl-[acyl-carrier-protein] reductase 